MGYVGEIASWYFVSMGDTRNFHHLSGIALERVEIKYAWDD